MMIVNVEFMAFIKRPDDIPRSFSKEIDQSFTISQFMKSLKFTTEDIRIMQFFISNPSSDMKNTRVLRKYTLFDGDQLFITIPVGGG